MADNNKQTQELYNAINDLKNKGIKSVSELARDKHKKK